MSDDQIRLLAMKFLEGRASDEEISTLLDWYAAHGDDQDVVIETDQPALEQDIHDRIQNRLQQTLRPAKSRLTNPIPLYRRNWTKAAAIILLLAGAAWLYRTTGRKQASNLVELKVPKQQRQKIVLPDGSLVWVNADSRIQYAAGFTSTSREVWLEGEAFFDVKTDPARPFFVHTTHSTTRVLGTAFDIKAYANDKQSSVTVIQGRVEVEDKFSHKKQLSQDQQALIDIAAGQLTGKTVAAESYQSWTHGALEFNGESFGEVARILNRRFGVNIVFKNEALTHCTFIATFESTDGIEKIVSLLCKTNANSYQIDSARNEISISGNSCF